MNHIVISRGDIVALTIDGKQITRNSKPDDVPYLEYKSMEIKNVCSRFDFVAAERNQVNLGPLDNRGFTCGTNERSTKENRHFRCYFAIKILFVLLYK